MEEKFIYNSRDERFKSPQGAVKSGTELTYTIMISKSVSVNSAKLVFLFDRHEEPAYYEMQEVNNPAPFEGDYGSYQARFTIKDTGLYWYHFVISTDNGDITVSRIAATNVACEGNSETVWQQTVYQRNYKETDWIYGGVFYHIFVDRFNHEGESVFIDGKRTRDDWGGVPEYMPKDGIITNNDFFGGNLKGITKKLPYLDELGVTCLYLSPIFEAYSNHKYDTGDYLKIDPMFGEEKDLKELCSEAGKRGIRVICDGVFAHTGADSIYFDKYHHYNQGGAFDNPNSKYRDWYDFKEDGSYEKWWGIDTLPKIKKSRSGFWDFINGSVSKYWLQDGISGWRLDVADELPSEFLEEFTKAVKKEKDDAIIIGEVWEDASNKEAYGERKNYFEGNKLDSVMNYPFKDAIIQYVRKGDSSFIANTVDGLVENYPPEVLNSLMNNLGTHDSERIITALAGAELPFDASREVQVKTRMSDTEWENGINLLKKASLIQMTLPGVPCIYYGDEVGTEGYKDPFNRTCFPWGHENEELLSWYKMIIRIRRDHAVYKRGKIRTAACFNGLYAFERYDDDDSLSRMITATNCGNTAEVLLLSGKNKDLITGNAFEGNITIYPGEFLLLESVEQ